MGGCSRAGPSTRRGGGCPLDEIRAQAPAGVEPLIDDLFEAITLWDCKAVEASFTALPDGTYRVHLVVEVRKLRADGDGVQTRVPVDDWIDIAVFGEQERDGEVEETVSWLDKRRISQERVEFELIVDERPVRAGVGPHRKLIDRRGEDNVVPVVAADALPGGRLIDAEVDARGGERALRWPRRARTGRARSRRAMFSRLEHPRSVDHR
ncbi:MAG: hypothetical protein K0V04_05380 [Deltaproteobacteria bacterium]|nr:hypothetical protein [Deltaproteobacteria bacterium]